MKRQALLKGYLDTKDYLKNIDDKILSLLKKNVGNIEEKIRHHQAELEREKYFFLVTGT